MKRYTFTIMIMCLSTYSLQAINVESKGVNIDACKYQSVNSQAFLQTFKHKRPYLKIHNNFSGYGMSYQRYYLRAEYSTVRPTAQKFNQMAARPHLHIASSSLSFGKFVLPQTLVYFKANFIQPISNMSVVKNSTLSAKTSADSRSDFMPGIGLEWHMRNKFSVGAEIRASFNRTSTDITSAKKRQQSALLFNVRYLIGDK